MWALYFSFSDGTIDFGYTLTDLNSGDPVIPDSLTVYMEDLSFSYIQGRFTEFQIGSGADTLDTELLDKLSGETLEIDNPEFDWALTTQSGRQYRSGLIP